MTFWPLFWTTCVAVIVMGGYVALIVWLFDRGFHAESTLACVLYRTAACVLSVAAIAFIVAINAAPA